MLEDNKVMKFYLIMPPRQSKYGTLFNIYGDLLYGFKEINVSAQVIEIDLFRNIRKDDYRQELPITRMTVSELVNWNKKVDKITIIVDDVPLITALYKNDFSFKKAILWSHFFYGQKMISYNRGEDARTLVGKVEVHLFDFIPRIIWNHFTKNYVKILRSANLAALSLYLCLMLNRTYNLQCKQVIYPPISLNSSYSTSHKHTNNVLLFLGGGEQGRMGYFH